MHLNPGEGRITLGFAGLRDGACSMAGLASARAMLVFCFGPPRAEIWIGQLLQVLCVMLGFCLGPQRAGMAAQSGSLTPIPVGPCSCSHHSADVRCIFCPSSPPAALDVEHACARVQAPLKGSLDLGMLLRTQRVGPQRRGRLHPLGDHHRVCRPSLPGAGGCVRTEYDHPHGAGTPWRPFSRKEVNRKEAGWALAVSSRPRFGVGSSWELQERRENRHIRPR